MRRMEFDGVIISPWPPWPPWPWHVSGVGKREGERRGFWLQTRKGGGHIRDQKTMAQITDGQQESIIHDSPGIHSRGSEFESNGDGNRGSACAQNRAQRNLKAGLFICYYQPST